MRDLTPYGINRPKVKTDYYKKASKILTSRYQEVQRAKKRLLGVGSTAKKNVRANTKRTKRRTTSSEAESTSIGLGDRENGTGVGETTEKENGADG